MKYPLSTTIELSCSAFNRPLFHCAWRHDGCCLEECTCECFPCNAGFDICHGYFLVDLDPGYPAPACANPSSPAYSDPGSPVCLEPHTDTCLTCGRKYDPEVDDERVWEIYERDEADPDPFAMYDEDSLEDR